MLVGQLEGPYATPIPGTTIQDPENSLPMLSQDHPQAAASDHGVWAETRRARQPSSNHAVAARRVCKLCSSSMLITTWAWPGGAVHLFYPPTRDLIIIIVNKWHPKVEGGCRVSPPGAHRTALGLTRAAVGVCVRAHV